MKTRLFTVPAFLVSMALLGIAQVRSTLFSWAIQRLGFSLGQMA